MALAAALAAVRQPAASSALHYYCCAAARLQIRSRAFAGFSPPHQQQEQQSSSSSPNSSSSSTNSIQASSSSSSSSSSDADRFHVVYEGFFARPHKRLKYASLLNSFASFAAAPAIISYSSASPIARVAVATSVLMFALITTGGLHWFTKPYVHQLLYNKQADMVRAQYLTLLGGTRWQEFAVSSTAEPTGYHPLASFKAQGRVFYIDRGNFHDKALMQRLMPWADQQEQQQQESEAAADLREGTKQPQQQQQQQQQQ
uniref:Transmembrane protein 186 n=1 Tax=Tetradesmus obliquus TaxID=3088 RepID=A0A383W2Y6_TETOB|eukprot:jgi/Sobl393_1/2999/SZX71841.1